MTTQTFKIDGPLFEHEYPAQPTYDAALLHPWATTDPVTVGTLEDIGGAIAETTVDELTIDNQGGVYSVAVGEINFTNVRGPADRVAVDGGNGLVYVADFPEKRDFEGGDYTVTGFEVTIE